MGFDATTAAKYDQWYRHPEGQYADTQEKELFLKLVQPRRGQSLLEIGCGTGHNLEFFIGLGLDVAGVDCSQPMLQIAAHKLGSRVKLYPEQANKLSFDDNSFDIVTLINVLEFLRDPAGVLKEAVRVSRNKVYIGVLNKASILSIARRIQGRFRKSIYNQARFYTLWEIEGMARRVLGKVSLAWESVLFFPLGWHRYCHRADHLLSFRKNPFGGFLGICITKPSQPPASGKVLNY